MHAPLARAAALALPLLLAAPALAADKPAPPPAAKPAPKPAPVAPVSPVLKGWQRFEAKDAGFTVGLPVTEPDRSARITEAVKMIGYFHETDDDLTVGVLLTVGQGDMDGADEELVRSLVEEGKREAVPGVKLDGRPAKGARIVNEESRIAVRQVVVQERHFTLLVRVPAAKPFPDKVAEAFFGSFKVLPTYELPPPDAEDEDAASAGDDAEDEEDAAPAKPADEEDEEG